MVPYVKISMLILLSVVQTVDVYCICTKENVANAINVDLQDIDLFCDPDGWFHDRINNHIKLEDFCGCSGRFDHDVYCNIEGNVETELDCSSTTKLPEPTPRLIEIRALKAKHAEESDKATERELAKINAIKRAQEEQQSKHIEEQERKESVYKKNVEEQEKRHKRYEEEEKTFIAEAQGQENLVENFLKEDQL